ncbi:MAG: hypothetical protein H6618_00555 [Deltaproteobacteria bacterium]|nr:hypothetical protein [Deltaproteobacteria bacterium]
MDILSLLKAERESLLQILLDTEEQEASGSALSILFWPMEEAIRLSIRTERDFLYPEISELLPNAAKLTELGQQQHERIEFLLEMLTGSLQDHQEASCQDAWGRLKSEILLHIRHQQERIMPEMRALIPTQDREDLAEILQDLRLEWTESGLYRPKAQLVACSG